MGQAVNNKGQTDPILLDFLKYLDKVPHERLPMKLPLHGITSKILNCVKVLWSRRSPNVFVNIVQSAAIPVTLSWALPISSIHKWHEGQNPSIFEDFHRWFLCISGHQKWWGFRDPPTWPRHIWKASTYMANGFQCVQMLPSNPDQEMISLATSVHQEGKYLGVNIDRNHSWDYQHSYKCPKCCAETIAFLW